MENGGPDACLVSAWEENKRNALSHYLRRTFESFHRNFTFYLGLRYCGDLVLLIQDSTKSLIPRGRRRSLLYETRGIKQANFEIQRKTILTSHIFRHLHDFLTQVSILHCENKKTLLVYKSNQKNSKLNDKKQRRTEWLVVYNQENVNLCKEKSEKRTQDRTAVATQGKLVKIEGKSMQLRIHRWMLRN